MQQTLTGETVEMRPCPKCRMSIKVWFVVGSTREDGTVSPSKLYGFCKNCVEGFYYGNR